MKNAAKYKIHRTIAIVIVPLLIISTATGFFRANQKWYWEEGYKKKKQSINIEINQSLFPLSILTKQIDSISRKKNKYNEITVQSENEALYYRILTATKEKYLVDAISGKIVSPINSQLAADFAGQYLKNKSVIKSCVLLKDYKPRKSKEIKPSYKIVFDNDVHSEIYLDYYTGEIIEDIDDNRLFGIWVVRLHDFDFFDAKRSISSIVGIGIFLLSLSGLWIYKIRRTKKREQLNN